ncbi:MAG: DUF2514 family protein [Rhizobacter sp.]
MTEGLIAAVVALLLLVGVQTVRLAKEQTAHQVTKTDRADKLAEQERIARAHVEAVRLREVARVSALEGVIHEKSALLESAQTDAAAARVAADRLRDKVARIAAAANARSANPGAAPASPPADNPTVVLTDVLGRIDARAGELAEFATRAHQAGQICEAGYDSVKGAQ